MKKEFKLSEKIITSYRREYSSGVKRLSLDDVREFIKRLKKETRQIYEGKPFYYSAEKKMQFVLDAIDKLSGDLK